MHFFFDTSALVKLFSNEEGSSFVRNSVDNNENTIWVSDLVRVEVHSAILRKFRNNEINSTELESIIIGIDEQLSFFGKVSL